MDAGCSCRLLLYNYCTPYGTALEHELHAQILELVHPSRLPPLIVAAHNYAILLQLLEHQRGHARLPRSLLPHCRDKTYASRR
jgi:hypothetical protein